MGEKHFGLHTFAGAHGSLNATRCYGEGVVCRGPLGRKTDSLPDESCLEATLFLAGPTCWQRFFYIGESVLCSR